MTKILFRSAALALTLGAVFAGAAIAEDAYNTKPSAVTAGAYLVEPDHTRIQFAISHMGFTNYYGDFTGASGTLSLDPAKVETSKVDITVPVASVSTTNPKLDGELKSADWFDAATYPTIRFVSTKVVSTAPNKATITGELTMHGVTKPVVLAATFNGSGVNALDKNYTVGFDATTTIRRSDFGVKTYLPMIGDQTSVRISAAFVKAK